MHNLQKHFLNNNENLKLYFKKSCKNVKQELGKRLS